MKRLILMVMLLVSLGGATQADAAAIEPKTSLPEVEEEVMCPVCGTLLGLSRSPAAERERVYIRKLIAQGKDKEQIKAALVRQYGGQVLAMPVNRGIDFWAYAVPVIGMVLAAIAVLWSVIAWRRRKPGPEDEEPSGPPDAPDSERIERDMARFDL